MAIEDFSSSAASALHLNYPPSGAPGGASGAGGAGGVLNSRSLTSVSVHPAALFTILDHYLRRTDPEPTAAGAEGDEAEGSSKPAGAGRVIGTLLGVRTDSEIEIRSAFAVPHNETSEQVQVDMEYHRTMLELHSKVNSEEVIVGWYATVGAEQAKDNHAGLNTYSALIQDFYSRETNPHQAVHLTVDTDVSRGDLGVRAYVGSPLGLTPKAENAVFLPLPVTLLSSAAERPTLSLLSSLSAASTTSAATDVASAPSTSDPSASATAVANGLQSDLGSLSLALRQMHSQISRVLAYVREVLEGKREGDPVVGRFIIDAVSKIPVSAAGKEIGSAGSSSLVGGAGGSANATTAGQAANGGAEETELESLFNAHLQDVLMISYLANVVRAQAEVSSRLTLLS